MADIAKHPVAHAQNILPDRASSGHVTDVTSGHVTSGSSSSQLHLKYDFVRTHILLMGLKWIAKIIERSHMLEGRES